MNSQRISALTPLADVLARVAALARPVAPREIALCRRRRPRAGGGCRRGGTAARAPVALVDGWAVRAEAGRGRRALCADAARARARMGRCRRRDAARHRCGAAARCRDERRGGACVRDGGRWRARGRAPMPRPASRCGAPGERLRAVDVAALQAVGISRVRVREPRVRVVAMPGCDAVGARDLARRRGAWRQCDLRARARTRARRRADRRRHHDRRHRRGARRRQRRDARAHGRGRDPRLRASRRARPPRSASRRAVRC